MTGNLLKDLSPIPTKLVNKTVIECVNNIKWMFQLVKVLVTCKLHLWTKADCLMIVWAKELCSSGPGSPIQWILTNPNSSNLPWTVEMTVILEYLSKSVSSIREFELGSGFTNLTDICQLKNRAVRFSEDPKDSWIPQIGNMIRQEVISTQIIGWMDKQAMNI